MTETFIEEKYRVLNEKCLNLEAQLKRANMKLDTIDAVAKQLVHMTNIATNHRIQIDELKDLIRELKPDCCYQEYNDELEQCLEPFYCKCKDCEMGKRVRNALKAEEKRNPKS